MGRMSFSQFDEYPHEMLVYLRNYGPHFNRKLYEFAVSKMYKNDKKIKPYTKDEVDYILKHNGVVLENNQLYDAVYVANMCKADFLDSSIKDEEHLAKYVKDVIDDTDGYDGIVFNRWYADMSYTGTAIDWESVL